MNVTIDPDSTLLDIASTWPATLPVFVAQGFPQMADATRRQAFAGAVSLRQATAMKKLDLTALVALLEDAATGEAPAAPATSGERPLRVTGLLPCPVRIPLEEAFTACTDRLAAAGGPPVEAELQAAAVGAGWIAEHVAALDDPDLLPDLFISAGFETFFDPTGIGRFRHLFVDRCPWPAINPAFADIDLADPEGRYAVIAVVPAVFLVNTVELGERPLPRTWADLLGPDFEQRVSLPVGDFDLFSGILLDIRRRFGDDGVRRLGRSLKESLHPAQMVKVGARPNPPVVTIMPNFFTKMAKPGGTLQAVWPEDGAIISPVFLLARDDDRVQPLVDFFCSREVADILAEKGLFPSAHPDAVNDLPPGATFSWLGWQWISSVDVKAEIAACMALFDEGKAAR